MPDPIVWPATVLRPLQVIATPVAWSRSGGRSIGGIDRAIRTDRGWWQVGYRGVLLATPAQRRLWNGIAVALGGRPGLLVAPVWQRDLVPGVGPVLTSHSDGTSFSDDSLYAQPGVRVEMVTEAARGATSATLRIVVGVDELVGVRFSYQHALYQTGFPTLVAGTDWTVPLFPAVRATIPAGALLEFDRPTCLVHLTADDAMTGGYSRGRVDRRDLDLVEATDYWADL